MDNVDDKKIEQLKLNVNERYALLGSDENAFKDELINTLATELYSLVIRKATGQIPSEKKKEAYYPYAGTDAVWGEAGSDLLILEDAFYDEKTPACRNHRREQNAPSTALTRQLFGKYKEYGLIRNKNEELELLKRNSRDGPPFKEHADSMLIYKRASSKKTPGSFMNEYADHKEKLDYGSVVVSGYSRELDGLMHDAGYKKVSLVNTDVKYDSSECGLFPQVLSAFVKK